MAIVKHKAGTSTPPLYIWAETANINYFLTSALTPVAAGGVVDKVSGVKAHARRQYPGDSTPINVAGSVREYVYDPGARNGSALPGKTFTLISDYGLPGEEKRQFTYQGRFLDLHGFLSNNVKFQVRLYGPTGKRYIIDKPGTP
jgi:hypothetical protein